MHKNTTALSSAVHPRMYLTASCSPGFLHPFEVHQKAKKIADAACGLCWSGSKAGYEQMKGTLMLERDTTVNLTLNLLSHVDQARLEGLALYPNPARSKFHIESQVRISRIEICDLRTAEISHQDANDKKVESDISSYPQGIYIAKI